MKEKDLLEYARKTEQTKHDCLELLKTDNLFAVWLKQQLFDREEKVKDGHKYNFTRYREVLGFQKSPKYMKWIKDKYPYLDRHHILGSTMGGGNKKFTDYLVIPIRHDHHLQVVEPHKAYWFNIYFEQSIVHLQSYAFLKLGFSHSQLSKLLPNYEPESVKAFIEAVYLKENEL